MPAVLRCMMLNVALLGASTWMFPIRLVAGQSELACDGIETLVSSLRRTP